MSAILIRRALLIDPESKTEKRGNIFIENGRIHSLFSTPSIADIVIDGDGLIASPGFIDMHSHLR
ncbi:MAG: dihydroorotase, partial [Planctomycetota bacterium]|nr:dihydroorotase [Planctomycetota bacterium]